MKESKDAELDALIKCAFERRELLADIQRQVEQTLQHRCRQRKWQVWGHRIVCCLSWAIVVVFTLTSAYHITRGQMGTDCFIPVLLSMVCFCSAVITYATKWFDTFSWS